ncbi:phosphorylase [Lewinellaceae bacterium SD302]|nr:phosphorylase [Lewinellaceae bacterium SD302]
MQASELILNPDGSVYHLHLLPEQIAETIITVGDPERVEQVSKRFDRVDFKVAKREFVTHTGWLGGQRLTVLSTGIGTDNIDIVFNELDALVNIDLNRREVREKLTSLNIIRIGTSGALRPELEVDSFLASSGAIGLEGLLHYYERSVTEQDEQYLEQLTLLLCQSKKDFPLRPYYAGAAEELVEKFTLNGAMHRGITLTAAGFYAPQGRELRLKSRFDHATLDQLIAHQGPNGRHITNLEMETAGIYGMAELLGHRAVSLNALLANRATGNFSKQPGKTVDKLIDFALEKLTEK